MVFSYDAMKIRKKSRVERLSKLFEVELKDKSKNKVLELREAKFQKKLVLLERSQVFYFFVGTTGRIECIENSYTPATASSRVRRSKFI